MAEAINIGIYRPGGLGDLVLAAPIFRALRSMKPTPWVHVWGHQDSVHLLHYMGLIDSFANIDEGLQQLDRPLDKIVAFDVKSELGYAMMELYTSRTYTWPLVSIDNTHQMDYIDGAIQQALPHPKPDTTIPFRVHIPRPARLRTPPQIVVHAGSSIAGKNWQMDKYDILVRDLLAEGYTVQPVQGWNNKRSTLGGVRVLSLPWLASVWLLAQAKLYIGNDTGLTHLAGILGLETIAIFGVSHPAIWRPRGPHIKVVRRCSIHPFSHRSWGHIDHDCYARISPSLIQGLVRDRLKPAIPCHTPPHPAMTERALAALPSLD